MPPVFPFIPSSKKAISTYLVETMLLVVGLYGLWLWLCSAERYASQNVLSAICFGIVPLIAFVYVVKREKAKEDEKDLSESFHFRLSQMQQRLNARDDFFQTVADCTPSAMTIFDKNNEYWFMNASAAAEWDLSEADVVGKKPIDVVGEERGSAIEKNLEHVKKSGMPLETRAHENSGKNGIRYIQTTYYPISSFGEFPGGVMMRDENVTTIMVERERRENMLRQVISTLVAVVDRRDPYAAGHSERVGQLSRELAVDLGLPDREAEAAEIAGSLMNFGKVLVPRTILTKTESLTQEELNLIRTSIMTSADILSRIDFSVPVVPTLRQILERYDGSGAPRGLKGDAILMTARIVTVANAFIALVSPRAYRPGIDFAVAAQNLAKDAGKAFDPGVIEALERLQRKNATKASWLAATKAAG
jgi:HD-GYP domain-containing protein (c-di-GMP phosphodiesterase class II)